MTSSAPLTKSTAPSGARKKTLNMLTIKRDSLLWAVKTAKELIGKSTITSPIQLRAGEQDLTVEGTNLDQCIRIKMPAEVKRVLTGAAPLDILAALSSATGDEVTIFEKGNRLNVTWGKAGRSSCAWTDQGLIDMPSSKGKPVQLELSPSLLKHVLGCAVAAGTDETRIHLMGVNLGRELLAGTDGHRCHVMQSRLPMASEQWPAPTVPVGFFTQLDKLGGSRIPRFILAADGNHVSCEFEHERGMVKVWTRCTDSTYPDILGVLPKSHVWRVWVNSKAMLDLITRAKNTGAEGLRLSGDPSIGLRVKIDKDIEFEDGIEAEFEEGKAIVPTGVAPKYLLDALKVCELEDKICISGTEPTAPMTVGLAEGRDSMVAVVMPMRL